jgi:hypothetical protein
MTTFTQEMEIRKDTDELIAAAVGGAAGYYATGNSNITWSTAGTGLGSVS